MWRTRAAALICGAVVAISLARVSAHPPQATQDSLGSARISRAVLADGQRLPPGLYTIRLSNAPVTPVVGQSADASHWVEFVQANDVKGRELATVVMPADVKMVAKEGVPPASGRARVEMLRGGDSLSAGIDRGWTQGRGKLALWK